MPVQPFLLHKEVHYSPKTTVQCGIFPLGEDGVPIADMTLLSTRKAGEELGETTSFLPTIAYNRHRAGIGLWQRQEVSQHCQPLESMAPSLTVPPLPYTTMLLTPPH